ncbi:hypothetical protein [Azospirillum doebereinerae]
MLIASAEMCMTTKTVAETPVGMPAKSRVMAANPPAKVPMTRMSRLSMFREQAPPGSVASTLWCSHEKVDGAACPDDRVIQDVALLELATWMALLRI